MDERRSVPPGPESGGHHDGGLPGGGAVTQAIRPAYYAGHVRRIIDDALLQSGFAFGNRLLGVIPAVTLATGVAEQAGLLEGNRRKGPSPGGK